MTAATDRRASVVTLLVGFVACGLFAGAAADVYDAVTEADGIAVVDEPVLRAALALRTPGLSSAVTAFTDLGSTLWMTAIVVVLASLLAWRRGSADAVVLTAVTAIGSVTMTVVGKAVVGRARPPFTDAVPPFESSMSFPSGHSLNSLALIGVLTYLAWLTLRRWWTRVVVGVLAGLFVVSMGLSRVYLGHHWFTDVLGAWLLALAWLTVVVTAHRLHVRAGRAGRRPRRGGDDPA